MPLESAAASGRPLGQSVLVFQQTIRPPSPPGGSGAEPAGGAPSSPGPPNIPLILGIVAVVGGAVMCMCLSGLLIWILAGGQVPFRLGPTAQPPTPVVTLVLGDKAEPPEATPQAMTTPTAALSADAESTARAFVSELSEAHERGDVDFLMNHLAQATLDRYGQDQCRSYLESHVGTATAFETVAMTYPQTFDYASDGKTTVIPDTVQVDIQFLALGTPATGSMHVLVENGQAYWFTDCGEPLP